MKLASLKDGRDGRLLVVSDDLGWCISGGEIAPSLRAALENWDRCAPQLRQVATFLNSGAPCRRRFEAEACAAPLPRAYPWADDAESLEHDDLRRNRLGSESCSRFKSVEPDSGFKRSHQALAGPYDPVLLTGAVPTLAASVGAAVIVGEAPRGASRAVAAQAIRLVLLKGAAFAPVAVSPDGLGEAWRDGRLQGVWSVEINGLPIGRADPVTVDFAAKVAQAARAGDLAAGTLISAEAGTPHAAVLRPGDRLRVEMRDAHSRSIFGAVDQRIEAAPAAMELEVA